MGSSEPSVLVRTQRKEKPCSGLGLGSNSGGIHLAGRSIFARVSSSRGVRGSAIFFPHILSDLFSVEFQRDSKPLSDVYLGLRQHDFTRCCTTSSRCHNS